MIYLVGPWVYQNPKAQPAVNMKTREQLQWAMNPPPIEDHDNVIWKLVTVLPV
jgi:hypothetical protein